MYICKKKDRRGTIPFKDIRIGEGFSYPKYQDCCEFGDRDRVYFIKTQPVKVAGRIILNALDAANGELLLFYDDDEVISENMFIEFADFNTMYVPCYKPVM